MSLQTKKRRRNAAPPLKPTLESFAWPLSSARFLEDYWHKRPFVSHGSARRLSRLLSDFKLQDTKLADIPRLLQTRPATRIHSYFPNPRGKQTRLHNLPPEMAAQLYRDGFSIIFYMADEIVDSWCGGLASSLGMRESSRFLMASHKSTDFELHFDYHETFSVQLFGVKRWWVAPNTEIISPTDFYSPSAPLGAELSRICEKRPKTPSTRALKEIDLAPGSVIYVPRGFWHGTASLEDALSFNITMPALTYADLFLKSLRNALITEPEWRRNADGALGNSQARSRVRQQLEKMLPKLTEITASLSKDLFPEKDSSVKVKSGWNNLPRAYQKNALTTFRLANTAKNGRYEVSFEHQGVTPLTQAVKLPRVIVTICRWIKSKEKAFDLEDIRHKFPHVPEKTVHELMELLLQARFIREVDQ